MTVTVRPVADADEVTELFHAYRAHYGHAGAVAATRAWLGEQLAEHRLRVAVAFDDGHPAGFVTTAVVPASLTLSVFWLVRDLYVAPDRRRRGVGARLVRHAEPASRCAAAVVADRGGERRGARPVRRRGVRTGRRFGDAVRSDGSRSSYG